MPIWTVVRVEQEPSTTLVRWQIIELPCADRHLVGFALEAREGRVCSAVQTFDLSQLRATTRSGRIYQLTGTPGVDLDGEYVWRRWARINNWTTWSDVTALVYAEHKEALSQLDPSTRTAARAHRLEGNGRG